MEHFEIAIKSYLEEKAKTDSVLAEKLKNSNKSISECCNYIISEVKKKITGQWAACTDDEVFGLTIHYWDEENIKVQNAPSANVVINRELSPEEKEEAEKLAEQKRAQWMAERKQKQEEALQRKKEEEAKAKRKKEKEEGLLFLFDE